MSKIFTVCLLLSVLHTAVYGQLWVEDFQSDDNATSGIAGGTVGGSWSVTTSPSGGTGSFSRQSNRFYIDNTGSEGVWTSNVVDIAAIGYAIIDVDVFSIGLGFSDSDYIRCYYRLDGGPEILFGDFPASFINGDTPASAIVAGNTLQIIIKGVDNSWLGYTQFDNVTITAAPVIYSRKTGNWNDVTGGANGTGTWSLTGFTGQACGCVPLASQVAVIGNGNRVDLNVDGTTGALDVRPTGTLRYTAADRDLAIEKGLVRVRTGGTINSNSQANAQIDYNGDFGGATLQVDAGGSLTMEDITLGTNASTLHYITGEGTINITDDIVIGADNAGFTNNATGTFSIADRIEFSSGTTNASFVNNQELSFGILYFGDDNNAFVNNGTAYFAVQVSGSGSDNNTITNAAGATVNIATINAGDGNLNIANYGTINQSGNFTNIVGGSNFVNASTGHWNWSLTPLASFDAELDDALNLTASGNTFQYSGAGTQTILAKTYQNLVLSDSDTKTHTAALDVNANLTLRNSATLSGATAIDVEGNIAIQNNAVLGGTGNIAVSGNWSAANANSFTEGTRTVTFDQGNAQTITNASGSESFYNLTVNKSGNLVTLSSSNVTVVNTLTLTSRGINLNGNTLTVANSNANAIAGSGYIVSEKTTAPYGYLARRMDFTGTRTFTFPFATSTGQGVNFTFDVTNAGAGTNRTVSVATYPTPANNLPFPLNVTNLLNILGNDNSSNVVNRYWIITPSGYTTNPTATVTFRFLAAEAAGVATPLVAQRWTNKWEKGKVGVATATSLRVAGLNSFSPWTLSAGVTPLPVELTSFHAALTNDVVDLKWTTASEKNNAYFTVERAVNVEQFEALDSIAGHGTTSDPRSYTLIDRYPLYGRSYYRLKQTDYDGTVTYSNVRMVDYEGPQYASLHAFPNPSQGKNIRFSIVGLADHAEFVTVQVFDSQGHEVFSQLYEVTTPGKLEDELHFNEQLKPGLYIMKVGSTRRLTQKIVIE